MCRFLKILALISLISLSFCFDARSSRAQETWHEIWAYDGDPGGGSSLLPPDIDRYFDSNLDNYSPPLGFVTDKNGKLYFSNPGYFRVQSLSQGNLLARIAGNNTMGDGGDGGEGSNAQLKYPSGLALDFSGNLYIVDSWSHRIRKVDSSGIISTVAGTGSRGNSGDFGPAINAELDYPSGLSIDPSGNLIVASGNSIRLIKPTGIIVTLVEGISNQQSNGSYQGIAVDSLGAVYWTNQDTNQVFKLSSCGITTVVAGRGERGFKGDNGPATEALLNRPTGLAVDSSGNIFVIDQDNSLIRKIGKFGIISSLTRDISPSEEESLPSINLPRGIQVDPFGNVMILDFKNHQIYGLTGIADGGLVYGLPRGEFSDSLVGTGDVNGDAKTTVLDAIIILRYVVSLAVLNDTQCSEADMNSDRKVNITDVIHILRKAVSLE